MSEEKNRLMIFIRNARIGEVKTRLAATIGKKAALDIYIRLLSHTAAVTRNLSCSKAVFYSEFIEEVDEFEIPVFQKYLQSGKDLGEKMLNAFIKSFSAGAEKVIIIGSDCYELTPGILNEAFSRLEEKDLVIGPANDGGYYLLGMKTAVPDLFMNKVWSTDNVFLDTLLDCKKLGLSYHVLPALNDIDEESDLTDDLRKIAEKK